MPRRGDPAQAMHMLDLLSEFFGQRPALERRTRFTTIKQPRCLISALAHLRAVMNVQGGRHRLLSARGATAKIGIPVWRFEKSTTRPAG